MGNKDVSHIKKEIKETNSLFDNVRSKYILEIILSNIEKFKLLKIIKNNKKLQNKLNINKKDFKECSGKYSSIELKIKPVKNEYGRFIYISNEEENYYHIYFDNDKSERYSYYDSSNLFYSYKYENKYHKTDSLREIDSVSEIKIIIDYPITSFKCLFYECKCIESVKFTKFYRNNIEDMSSMFYFCTSLKNIDFSNFNTENVNDMSHMFHGCSALKSVNLKKFNTNKVNNMSCMFLLCKSIKELNLSDFNTEKVNDMSYMFKMCSSLKNLYISNFNIDRLINSEGIFSGCDSLKKIKIFNNDGLKKVLIEKSIIEFKK